jgi:hypothetical protein
MTAVGNAKVNASLGRREFPLALLTELHANNGLRNSMRFVIMR